MLCVRFFAFLGFSLAVISCGSVRESDSLSLIYGSFNDGGYEVNFSCTKEWIYAIKRRKNTVGAGYVLTFYENHYISDPHGVAIVDDFVHYLIIDSLVEREPGKRSITIAEGNAQVLLFYKNGRTRIYKMPIRINPQTYQKVVDFYREIDPSFMSEHPLIRDQNRDLEKLASP